MNSLVIKLEKRLLPEFQNITDRINKTIPNISARVESSSIGSDEHLGHLIAISCLFTKDYFTEVDEVALCINIGCLVSTPRIDAYVCWGYPSGYSEADFPVYVEGSSNNSLVVSDEVLEDLYSSLPRLYSALFKALKRRKPGDE